MHLFIVPTVYTKELRNHFIHSHISITLYSLWSFHYDCHVDLITKGQVVMGSKRFIARQYWQRIKLFVKYDRRKTTMLYSLYKTEVLFLTQLNPVQLLLGMAFENHKHIQCTWHKHQRHLQFTCTTWCAQPCTAE